jgi:uncharacterized protein YukE
MTMSKNPRILARSPRRTVTALLMTVVLAAIGLTAVTTSGAAVGPANTNAPNVTGTAQEGQTLTTSNGTWTGAGTISYQYHWQRCNPDATGCANIAGATSQTYVAGHADIGDAIRSVITATDTNGSTDQQSAITATVIAAANLAPANTVPPTISGTPSNGQTLTVANGTWTGAAPITYGYAWQLCDATGNACVPISGATASTYALASTAVGKTLRTVVTGTNPNGTQSATTVPTAVIGSAAPTTLIKLPNGKTSVDASDVKGSARLILSGFTVQQTQPLHTRAPFRVTFTVTDTRGYVVRNALVYVIGLPYNRILNAPEQRTAQDGTVTFALTPTKLQPLKVGARLVIFARARVDGDSLLAGASSRRLVEVVFGAPSS